MDDYDFDFEPTSDLDAWEDEQVFQDSLMEEDEFFEFNEFLDSLQDEDEWLGSEYEAHADGVGDYFDEID